MSTKAMQDKEIILNEAVRSKISDAAFRQLFTSLFMEDITSADMALFTGKSRRTIARSNSEIDRAGLPVIEPIHKVLAAIAREVYPRQPIPFELRKAVYERDGYACLRCGRTAYLSCDHVIPVTSGGETIIENLQTLCLTCNRQKSVNMEVSA